MNEESSQGKEQDGGRACCHVARLAGGPARSGAAEISCRPRSTAGQVRIPGGRFVMGDAFGEGYAADGQRPLHEVELAAFFRDETAVTTAQFAEFADTTGYVSEAEELGVSAVFYATVQAAAADVLHRLPDTSWWIAVRGASWRHPFGPESTAIPDHPAVHITWNDAQAYARWAGKRLRRRRNGSTQRVAGCPARVSRGATNR